MPFRIGLAGLDSSHAEDFLRHFNTEERYRQMRVTAMWGGSDERLAELAAGAPAVAVALSLETLIEQVDAVIVGDRHGDLHRPHALPVIAAGKPVFVDKPFANSLREAEAMAASAERAGVPLLSGSALRWQPETMRLKARLAELDGPYELGVYGTWYPENEYGGAIFYAIHTIELVLELLGTGWRELELGGGGEPTLRCRFGTCTVTMTFRPPNAAGLAGFGVEVNAPGVRFHHPIPLGDDYMAPVCGKIAEMLQSGVSPITAKALVAPVRMMEEISALLKPAP